MEDWEKRFSELEAEVDAEFSAKEKVLKDTGAARTEADETITGTKNKEARKIKKENKEEDDDDSLFDDIAKNAAAKAIQKTAEKSLAKMGTNKAIIYSVGAILAALFIYKNLFFLIFCGIVIGGLYYYLEGRGDDDEEETKEIESDL